MKTKRKNSNKLTTKRHLRADGLSLLPSALRPRLVGDSGSCASRSRGANVCGSRSRSKNENENGSSRITRYLHFRISALFVVVLCSLLFSFFLQTSYALNVSAASLTLTIPSTPLSLDISPLKESNFQKSSTSKISVKTDSESGYTLSIKSKNNNDYDKLVNGTNKLDSISSALSESDYQNTGALNTWGWLPSKLNGENNSDFQPSPKNSEETILDITEDKNDTSSNTYDITLAAKTNQAIAPGNYTNTFVITSIVNPPKVQYMQNWTGCDDLPDDGQTYVELTDSRDDNVYKVAKLKDGKCWMLQNLRIIDKEISYLDSDMTEEAGTFKIPENNLSKFVSNDSNNDAVWYNVESETKEEDGAYYSWHTATAGSGTTDVVAYEAINSICPKGWRLPRDGTKSLDTNEFIALIEAYGGNGLGGTNDNQQAVLDQLVSPAFPNFNYAGYVGYSSGALTYYGTGGRYWSSSALSSTTARGLYYDASNGSLVAINSTQKQSGRSLRCIADDSPRTTITVTYHLNSGSGEQTNPSIQRPIDSKISLDTPTRSDYGLVGWCDQYTTGSDCPGKLVRPGETYEVGEQTSLDFYAVWKRISDVVNKGSLGTMQNFNCDTSLPEINDYGTVIDSRDNTEYKVARLIDNRCWMIDNLKIVGRSISSSDSDMENGSFTIPASNLSTFRTSESNVNNSAAYVGTYGGYYTWYTATAGTGNSSIASVDVNATGSICPKGWKLPTGGPSLSSDFAYLVNAYGGNNSTGSANLRATLVPGFTFAGRVEHSSGSFLYQGYNGYYWSSTSGSSTYAYYLFFEIPSVVGFSSLHYRVHGLSVRCVAQ